MSTHTHYFVVAANDEYDGRTAEIVFTDKANNLSETVTVTQVQKNAVAYNTMDGWVKRKATFKQDRSMISGIASYSDNVSISCNMSYSLSMSLFGLFPILFGGIVLRLPYSFFFQLVRQELLLHEVAFVAVGVLVF